MSVSLRRPCAFPKRPGKSGEGAALANGDGGGCGGAPPQLPSDGTDRTQNVWQWILESERQVKHKTHR